MNLKDFKNTPPMEHIKRVAQLKTIAGTKNYKIIPFKMGFWKRLIFLFTNKANIVIETDNQPSKPSSKAVF